jgi:hypothetical protein
MLASRAVLLDLASYVLFATPHLENRRSAS